MAGSSAADLCSLALWYGGLDLWRIITTLLLAICLSLIGGVGNGMVFTAVNYLIQKEPPQQAIGRVSGIVDSTLSVLFIAGPLLGGVMISQFGILAAFKGIGMSLTFIGFSGILFQKLLWKRNKNTENNKIDSDGEAVS